MGRKTLRGSFWRPHWTGIRKFLFKIRNLKELSLGEIPVLILSNHKIQQRPYFFSSSSIPIPRLKIFKVTFVCQIARNHLAQIVVRFSGSSRRDRYDEAHTDYHTSGNSLDLIFLCKKGSASHNSYCKSCRGLNKGPLCCGCETAFGIDYIVVRVGKLSPVLTCLVQKATQNRDQMTLQQSFP